MSQQRGPGGAATGLGNTQIGHVRGGQSPGNHMSVPQGGGGPGGQRTQGNVHMTQGPGGPPGGGPHSANQMGNSHIAHQMNHQRGGPSPGSVNVHVQQQGPGPQQTIHQLNQTRPQWINIHQPGHPPHGHPHQHHHPNPMPHNAAYITQPPVSTMSPNSTVIFPSTSIGGAHVPGNSMPSQAQMGQIRPLHGYRGPHQGPMGQFVPFIFPTNHQGGQHYPYGYPSPFMPQPGMTMQTHQQPVHQGSHQSGMQPPQERRTPSQVPGGQSDGGPYSSRPPDNQIPRHIPNVSGPHQIHSTGHSGSIPSQQLPTQAQPPPISVNQPSPMPPQKSYQPPKREAAPKSRSKIIIADPKSGMVLDWDTLAKNPPTNSVDTASSPAPTNASTAEKRPETNAHSPSPPSAPNTKNAPNEKPDTQTKRGEEQQNKEGLLNFLASVTPDTPSSGASPSSSSPSNVQGGDSKPATGTAPQETPDANSTKKPSSDTATPIAKPSDNNASTLPVSSSASTTTQNSSALTTSRSQREDQKPETNESDDKHPRPLPQRQPPPKSNETRSNSRPSQTVAKQQPLSSTGAQPSPVISVSSTSSNSKETDSKPSEPSDLTSQLKTSDDSKRSAQSAPSPSSKPSSLNDNSGIANTNRNNNNVITSNSETLVSKESNDTNVESDSKRISSEREKSSSPEEPAKSVPSAPTPPASVPASSSSSSLPSKTEVTDSSQKASSQAPKDLDQTSQDQIQCESKSKAVMSTNNGSVSIDDLTASTGALSISNEQSMSSSNSTTKEVDLSSTRKPDAPSPQSNIQDSPRHTSPAPPSTGEASPRVTSEASTPTAEKELQLSSKDTADILRGSNTSLDSTSKSESSSSRPPGILVNDQNSPDDQDGKGSDSELPKLPYQDGQWTPQNREGQKLYSREFLWALKDNPLSIQKPKMLEDKALDIIRNSPNTRHTSLYGGRRSYPLPTRSDPFLPNFSTPSGPSRNSSMGPSHMLPRMPGTNRRLSQPNRPSNAGHPRIILAAPMNDPPPLKKSENAWKPKKLEAEDPVEAETLELLKRTRGLLNKLTPEKFDTLVKKIEFDLINSEDRLRRVLDLIFEKAVHEPSFCTMYATLCKVLSQQKVQTTGADGKPTNVKFSALLLTKCQKEFEGDVYKDVEVEKREEAINNESDHDKKKALMEELDEEKRRARKRALGNIKLIGELYKLNMLVFQIVVYCIQRLCNQASCNQDYRDESMECLCIMLKTIGLQLEKDISHNKKIPQKEAAAHQSAAYLDEAFNYMKGLTESKTALCSRVRFMVQDILELRDSNWVSKRENFKPQPKTIQQIHDEAKVEDEKTREKIKEYEREKNLDPSSGSRPSRTPIGNRPSGGRDSGNRKSDNQPARKSHLEGFRSLAALGRDSGTENDIQLGPGTGYLGPPRSGLNNSSN